MRLTGLIPAVVLALSACYGDSPDCVRLSAAGRYCLATGPWPEFAVEQHTVVTFQGNSTQMIARLEAGAVGLRFAGVTPLGQTLVKVSWENGKLRSEFPAGTPGRIDGGLFPALLQIALWPGPEVRRGLSAGLALIEEDHRRVVRDGDLDLLIVSWEGNTLPYARLRFEAPDAAMVIDAKTLLEIDE